MSTKQQRTCDLCGKEIPECKEEKVFTTFAVGALNGKLEDVCAECYTRPIYDLVELAEEKG